MGGNEGKQSFPQIPLTVTIILTADKGISSLYVKLMTKYRVKIL